MEQRFLSHHLARILTAAVYFDARHIDEGITFLKQRRAYTMSRPATGRRRQLKTSSTEPRSLEVFHPTLYDAVYAVYAVYTVLSLPRRRHTTIECRSSPRS